MPALRLSRDSPDKVVMDSFKKVAKKAHPDKGGSTEDAQKLNAARRGDLSRHTAAGQKFLQFCPIGFFLKTVSASESKSSNDIVNSVGL